MNIQDLIRPELLVLIPVCWGLGLMLKSTPINNQWVPAILCLCSIFLSGLYISSTAEEAFAMEVFLGITQGVICWLAAWQGYDKLIKPSGKE